MLFNLLSWALTESKPKPPPFFLLDPSPYPLMDYAPFPHYSIWQKTISLIWKDRCISYENDVYNVNFTWNVFLKTSSHLIIHFFFKFGCEKISVKLNIVILPGKFPVSLHANCIFFKKYQHNESKGNLYRVSAFWRHLLPKLTN